MSKQRRRFSADFKFRVALEAVKGQQTISELSSKHSVHPNQISQWKRQLLESGAEVFSRNGTTEQQEAIQAELYEQIGRLKMELEWLKKKLPNSVEIKRTLIEPNHLELSMRRQCELLDLNRLTLYYQPVGEAPDHLYLMRLSDEQYLRTPFYGWPRMTAYLRRKGHAINHKRVQRLMQKMGLQAIYPKPKTSMAGKEHMIYPYLLRDLEILQPNFVWSADITYVPMRQGFMYLVAIIDWFSRYVLTWQLSNTLDGYFCLDALQQALPQGRPQIFNTDQGAQFTAHAFTACLERAGIQISMDGRGRALDNIFVERLWRTVKYEDIYLKEYATVSELDAGLANFFRFYNHERLHQSLAYRTPAEVHSG
jgi:putative transposase